MAQFDFLGTWNDSWDVVSAILEPGDVRLIPALMYEQPQARFLSRLGEVHELCLAECARFYISCERFTRHPPEFWEIKAGKNKGRFAIDDRKAGPLLDLSLPGCFRYDDVGVPYLAIEGGPGMHLAPGTLSNQREYLNPDTQEWEWVAEAVKAGFKDIVRRVKKRLLRHQFHKPIWIGRNALCEVQAKNAMIHGFGLD
ncbi:MAG: hypothetical protein JSS02_00860 [Planctomycetes bacterium]|nr:hypothetical protein [Planctomycetota bacterium]